MQVFHVVGFERHCAKEQGKQDDTCTPQISLESLVTLVFDDLRSDVGGSTTLLVHDLTRFDSLGHTKISDLDQAFTVKKDVVKLDVSMYDIL